MAHPDDLKLLQRAQTLGFVTQADGVRCLAELESSERAGKPVRLAQLLLQMKLVTSEQMVAALRPEAPRPAPKTTALRKIFDLAEAAERERTPTRPIPLDPAAAREPSPGQPVRSPKKPGEAELAVGDSIGDFELVREISQGGMGLLFEAQRRSGPYQRFALKLLSLRANGNAALVERFTQEGLLTAELDHPNIVKVHEVGFDKGRHFIVMDFFEGRSLAELAREGRLAPRKAIEVIAVAARAAEYMHDQDVIHRDLKPANILVGKRGNVAITDFGLAKDLARADATLTMMGLALGTPYYMSPEQARGELHRVGPWSDVYALGATLYRSIAGTYAFDADSMVTAVQMIATEDAPPLDRRRPDVPSELAQIVSRSMARDPEQRPGAGSLALQLEALLQKHPVQMPPAPPNPKV